MTPEEQKLYDEAFAAGYALGWNDRDQEIAKRFELADMHQDDTGVL